MSRKNIEPRTLENLIIRFRRRPRSPRYPFIALPGLALSCTYQHEVVSLQSHEIDVQLMPSRQSIVQAIQRELPKQHYDQTLTIAAVQEVLRTSGIHLSTPVAIELYNSVVPSTFARWIAQFSAEDRPLVFKLYRALRFFSYDEVRRQFRSLLEDQLRGDTVRRALFIGVGKHLAKSGTHLLYMIKHIYRDLYPTASKGDIELRFQHPSVILERGVPPGTKLEALIFVDDFVGSGETSAKSFRSFRAAYAHHSELRKLSTWYVTITGFVKGVSRIVDEFPDLSGKILAASGWLTDEDRAFAWPGKIFENRRREWLRGKQLCSEIGTNILRPYFSDPNERSRHVLGWEGDQALVAFEHNTPNNTLPIFWASGIFRGRRWHPLFTRWE